MTRSRRRIVRIALLLGILTAPGWMLAAAAREQPVSRGDQSRRLPSTLGAGDAPLHAGRVHGIRPARAGKRTVPDQVPARELEGRRDRNRERHARRQRRVRDRGLRSAHRQACGVQVRGARSGNARHRRETPDPGAARRDRPGAHLQDLQGPADVHDERRRHRLGAQPERIPVGRRCFRKASRSSRPTSPRR